MQSMQSAGISDDVTRRINKVEPVEGVDLDFQTAIKIKLVSFGV